MYQPHLQSQEAKIPHFSEELLTQSQDKLPNNSQFTSNNINEEIPNPALQKGILKYFRKTDYFLSPNSTNDISNQSEKELQLQQQAQKEKQGTFLGVFAPVMQNIFGVLLFIRVPSITGEAGIIEAFLISLICCITTFITTLSLSAVATNGKIFKGGAYYIISRSMGGPIGSAIGICFYLGTTFGGAMYILGAAESFIRATQILIGGIEVSMRIYGIILLVFITLINLVGLKYIAKTDLAMLSIVLLAILSIYLGFFINSGISYENGDFPEMEEKYQYAPGITGISHIKENWENNKYSRYVENNFFMLLAIYSPAVTGIMAGANRSGDLINPSKSLPKGTLTAQLITSVVYVSAPVFFGLVCDRNTLQTEEYLVAAEISWPTRYLTQVAIILSSLGSGLQSIVGAPRILTAIAEDDNLAFTRLKKETIKRLIFPVTIIICFGAVMIGDINAINPIITMFFLICYGFINLCCFCLDLIQNPSWRPTWKFYNKYLSLLGFFICFFLMIVINWWSFLIAVVIISLLYYVIYKEQDKNPQEIFNYGDFIDAVKLIWAKSSLFSLINAKKHVKNWIPIVLVVGDYDSTKEDDQQIEAKGALFFLETIKKSVSFTVYGNYLEGDYTLQDIQKKKEQEKAISAWMKKENLKIVNKTLLCKKSKNKNNQNNDEPIEPLEGLLFLIQGAGLGGLEPNTIITNFPTDFRQNPEKAEKFVQFVAFGVRMEKAVFVTVNDENFAPKMEILLDNNKPKRTKQQVYKKSIDIWSFSYENGLMILMSYFLHRSHYWQQCPINIFIITLNPISNIDKIQEEQRIKNLVISFLIKYRLYDSKKFNVNVEIIQISDYQQIEGLLLTEGKKQQLEQYPEQFQNLPVDPTYSYGMKLNDNQSVQENQDQESQSQEKNQPKKIDILTMEQNLEQQQQTQEQTNLLQQEQQKDSDLNLLQNQTQTPNPNPPKKNKKQARILSVVSHSQVKSLNKRMREKSSEADLVVMNLPEPVNQRAVDYLEYIRNLTQGFQRVLMIRNTKQDCISDFT